ncbi:zinc-binding dehydrogenase [Phycisphaerales bacterium AB-hyl4]|uniref:Zinc-binding dehydrogenase n=1 Tax=Natronomicrosphaera hydrolytica TaxID=3242702 RepID=A0ABV4U6W8_9BACT
MTAATVVAPGRVVMQQVSLPEPGPGQVRVRLEGCGVCASNVPVWEGRPWFTYPLEPGGLGHEGWGRVDAVGEGVREVQLGERVAFISEHAYAEYDVTSASSVVVLPSELDDEPLPGEPLGCAMNVMRRSGIEAEQTVGIIGIGFLGALLTQLARGAGARVIAMARRPAALATARAMGADDTVTMDDHERVIGEVQRLTGGRWCDVVIEASGAQWPIDLAGEVVKVRGRLVIAGYHQDGARQVNMQLWNWRGLDVVNAHEREPSIYRAGIEAAVQAMVEGRLRPGGLYTHRFRLGQLGEALDMTRDRPEGFGKALMVM